MLEIRSFKFDDADAMNELLRDSIISKRAQIFVSNGEIIIPIENGLLPNNKQRIKLLEETIIDFSRAKDEIDFSQEAMTLEFAKIEQAVVGLKEQYIATPQNKQDVKHNKSIDSEIKRLDEIVGQKKKQFNMNLQELNRININIEVAQIKIAELSKDVQK